MEIKTNYFISPKTARYSTYGELTPSTKYFWFALHGSKMLCEQMLYKFKNFDPKEHFILAPESFNRFYEKDFGGPVVASWMTKRDRLHEIKDNGKGYNINAITLGNGINNIKKRASDLNAEIFITSKETKGTQIVLLKNIKTKKDEH